MILKAALGAAVVCGGFLCLTPSAAQDVEAISADQILRDMSETLVAAEAFTVSVEKTFDAFLVNGHKVQFSGALDLAVRRPDRLYVSYGDELSAKELWYDGSEMVLLDHRNGLVGRLDVSGVIDEAVERVAETHGVVLPLGELISSDVYEQINANMISGEYLGTHDVAGTPAYHLLLIGERLDVQLWIDAGALALPLKMVITHVDEPSQPQESFLFSDWDLEARLSDDLFDAEIPGEYAAATFLPLE